MGERLKKLLVVDDDPIDARFVLRAFSDVADKLEIVHVADAQMARFRLDDEPFDYALLDINMPGTNGLELLKQIRTSEKTAVMPVIMLTSSMNPDDVHLSYENGANAYAVKPSSVSGYRKFAEGFTRFWVDVVVGPH